MIHFGLGDGVLAAIAAAAAAAVVLVVTVVDDVSQFGGCCSNSARTIGSLNPLKKSMFDHC